MKLLVLQHATLEHPGIFRSFLEEDGHTYDAVELDQGEALPELDGYDALWVMGGPMDVWQEDKLIWEGRRTKCPPKTCCPPRASL